MPLGSVPSLERPVWLSTERTSGKERRMSRKVCTILVVSVSDDDMGSLASTHSAPSFSSGKNSEPRYLNEYSDSPITAKAAARLKRWWEYVQPKARVTMRSKKLTMGLFFSRTFLLSRMEESTGTSVRVRMRAPTRAKPSV